MLVRIVAKLFPEFHLSWFLEEAKRDIPLELDFLNEAANADKMRKMCSHLSFLKIPKIYYQYTSNRVLTMEYCEGAHINDIDYFLKNKIDRYDVCRKLGALYSEMIFIKGFVHCDPHPGNVLVHKQPDGGVKIILLDHGQYLDLPDDFRLKYSKLWLAILKPDEDEIKHYATELGVGKLYALFACIVTRRTWKAIIRGVRKTDFSQAEKSEVRARAVTLLTQISEVLQEMPRPLLLIFKTNDLLRNIEYQLGTLNRGDTFVQMSRGCIKSVYGQAMQQHQSFISRCVLWIFMYFELVKIFVFEKYQMLIHHQYVL